MDVTLLDSAYNSAVDILNRAKDARSAAKTAEDLEQAEQLLNSVRKKIQRWRGKYRDTHRELKLVCISGTHDRMQVVIPVDGRSYTRHLHRVSVGVWQGWSIFGPPQIVNYAVSV
ncbi:MAG: hypothetical protein OHK0046_47690 [Anaerolineae bacterium]